MIAADTNVLLRYPLNTVVDHASFACNLTKSDKDEPRLNTQSIEKDPKRPG